MPESAAAARRLRRVESGGKAQGKTLAGEGRKAGGWTASLRQKNDAVAGGGRRWISNSIRGAAEHLAFAAHALKTTAVGRAGGWFCGLNAGCCMNVQYPLETTRCPDTYGSKPGWRNGREEVDEIHWGNPGALLALERPRVGWMVRRFGRCLPRLVPAIPDPLSPRGASMKGAPPAPGEMAGNSSAAHLPSIAAPCALGMMASLERAWGGSFNVRPATQRNPSTGWIPLLMLGTSRGVFALWMLLGLAIPDARPRAGVALLLASLQAWIGPDVPGWCGASSSAATLERAGKASSMCVRNRH